MGYKKGAVHLHFKKDTSGNTLYYPHGIFGRGFIIESKDTANQIETLFTHQFNIGINSLQKRQWKKLTQFLFLCLAPFFFLPTSANYLFPPLFLLLLLAFTYSMYKEILIFLVYKQIVHKSKIGAEMTKTQQAIKDITRNLQKTKKQNLQVKIQDIFERYKNTALHYNLFMLILSVLAHFALIIPAYFLISSLPGLMQITITHLTEIILPIKLFLFIEVPVNWFFGFILPTIIEIAFLGIFGFCIIISVYMIAVKVQNIWNHRKLSFS